MAHNQPSGSQGREEGPHVGSALWGATAFSIIFGGMALAGTSSAPAIHEIEQENAFLNDLQKKTVGDPVVVLKTNDPKHPYDAKLLSVRMKENGDKIATLTEKGLDWRIAGGVTAMTFLVGTLIFSIIAASGQETANLRAQKGSQPKNA